MSAPACRVLVCVALLTGLPAGGALRADAPPGARLAPAAVSGTNLLVAYGTVFWPDGVTPWVERDTVIVTNRRTGVSLSSVMSSLDRGKYEAAFVDFSTGDAAREGDTLSYRMSGTFELVPNSYVLTATDITTRGALFDTRIDRMPPLSSDPPTRTELRLAIFPSPLRGPGRVQFALPARARVEVAVFGVQGQHLRRLFDGELGAGVHALTWDATNDRGSHLPSGIYFIRLRSVGAERVARVVLTR